MAFTRRENIGSTISQVNNPVPLFNKIVGVCSFDILVQVIAVRALMSYRESVLIEDSVRCMDLQITIPDSSKYIFDIKIETVTDDDYPVSFSTAILHKIGETLPHRHFLPDQVQQSFFVGFNHRKYRRVELPNGRFTLLVFLEQWLPLTRNVRIQYYKTGVFYRNSPVEIALD